MTSTQRAAAIIATVGKIFLWTLLAAYLAVVILLNITAVDWETRTILNFVALVPLTVAAGMATFWQLVRRRRELSFGRQTWGAVAGALTLVALAAVTASLVGYLTA